MDAGKKKNDTVRRLVCFSWRAEYYVRADATNEREPDLPSLVDSKSKSSIRWLRNKCIQWYVKRCIHFSVSAAHLIPSRLVGAKSRTSCISYATTSKQTTALLTAGNNIIIVRKQYCVIMPNFLTPNGWGVTLFEVWN